MAEPPSPGPDQAMADEVRWIDEEVEIENRTQHLVVVLDLRIPRHFDAIRDQVTEVRDALLEVLHIEPPIDGQISVFMNEAADDMTSVVTTQMEANDVLDRMEAEAERANRPGGQV